MSFSTEIKKELFEIKNKKSCCRLSFLVGLFIDTEIEDEKLKLNVTGQEVYEIATEALKSIHRGSIETEKETILGMEIYHIRISSDILHSILERIDNAEQYSDIFNYSKCTEDNCKKCLLRGIFVSSGTINEPCKGYHLELKFKNAERAAFVYRLLSETGFEPKISNRRSGSSVGLYYKNSSSIEDLMTYLGAVKCTFDFINTKIEREIRNSVNRSTNCVAGNISKSVKAAQKQLAVISALDEIGKLSLLPDELYETAKLRLANPSASLSELAILHEPPISKSGLTHRLSKIMEISEENL